MRMKLVTAKLREKLLRNGARPGADHIPPLKLFDPNGAGTWLIAEMDPEAPDRLFGLGQPRLASPPEVGVVSLAEMERYRRRFGIGIERDRHFVGRFPLSIYAEAARRAGHIVTSGPELDAAAASIARGVHAP